MVASNQYIEEIIAMFARATEANLHTPTREGNVMVITEESADEVMITGDLHGHRRNFNLIKKIAALDKHPKRHLVLQEVCHGGPLYIQNSGCMSHTVLEDVAILKNKFPDRVHFILGNHELAELTDFPIQKNKQLLNHAFQAGIAADVRGGHGKGPRGVFVLFYKAAPWQCVCRTESSFRTAFRKNCDTQGFDADVFQSRDRLLRNTSSNRAFSSWSGGGTSAWKTPGPLPNSSGPESLSTVMSPAWKVISPPTTCKLFWTVAAKMPAT